MAKVLRTYLLGSLLAGISLMPVLVAAWYCTSQAIIYHQMETALEQEHLETIILTTADIIWLKAGKEILLGNQPFDVKKAHRIADKTIITGLYDYKEKALKEKPGKLDSDDMQHNRQVKITMQLLLFTPAQGIYFTRLISSLNKNISFVCFKEHFRQNDYSLLTVPPPRFAYHTLG